MKTQVATLPDRELRTLLKTVSMTAARTSKLADLANGFANNSCGRPRMQLELAAVYDPSEQTYPTATD
jgi:hypothetical protein